MKRDLAIVVVATCALLVPFGGRAFHVDDPLYVWSARHILNNPLHPYSFSVNWAGTPASMWEQTKNPPGMAYCLAAGIGLVGEGEWRLHLWVLPWSIAAAVAMYLLSRRYTRRPLWPCLALVASPVFAVSATSVMADVPALALFLLGILLFLEGADRGGGVLAALGGLCLGMAALTKYLAVGGIGLVLIDLAFRGMGRTRAARWLAIPVGMIAMWSLYGIVSRGGVHLAEAASFSGAHLGARTLASGGIAALSFAGGALCFPLVVVFPLLRRWRARAAVAGAGVVCCVLVATMGRRLYPTGAQVNLVGQVLVFVFASAGAGALAIALGGWRRGKATSLLLRLWVVGVVFFAAVLNWTVNARTILFVAPPLAILLWQATEARWRAGARLLWGGAVGASALVSILVACADARLANSYRAQAQAIQPRGGQVLFPNHWGFQYYMEKRGFEAIDFAVVKRLAASGRLQGLDTAAVWRLVLRPSDRVVAAEYASASSPWFGLSEGLELMGTRAARWPLRLHTMDLRSGAAFYSSRYGPLPFGIGSDVIESFRVYRSRQRR